MTAAAVARCSMLVRETSRALSERISSMHYCNSSPWHKMNAAARRRSTTRARAIVILRVGPLWSDPAKCFAAKLANRVDKHIIFHLYTLQIKLACSMHMQERIMT